MSEARSEDDLRALHGTPDQRRAQLQARAAAIGVDEAFIERLVHEFYARIRADSRLGPIFEAAIEDRWDAHLSRMTAFWSSVALNSGRYSGKPVPAHARLSGLTPDDFALWLSLFRQTLDDIAPTQDAAEYFMVRAERIARSLIMALFGFPRFGERPADAP